MKNKKTAFITGVSRREGLGYATAQQLGKLGYAVIVSARNQEQAQALAAELQKDGIEAQALAMDVCHNESVSRAAAQVAEQYGHLDVLVNNAALMLNHTATIADKNLEELDTELQTNITGVWRVTQAFYPLLKASPQGRVVNVSSTMGSFTVPGWGLLEYSSTAIPAYSITKLALNGLTIKMAKEFGQSKILVNAVCPGFTATRPGMAEMGARPVAESVNGIIWAATLPDDGPTGQFFRDGQPLSW